MVDLHAAILASPPDQSSTGEPTSSPVTPRRGRGVRAGAGRWLRLRRVGRDDPAHDPEFPILWVAFSRRGDRGGGGGHRCWAGWVVQRVLPAPAGSGAGDGLRGLRSQPWPGWCLAAPVADPDVRDRARDLPVAGHDPDRTRT